MLTIKTLLLFQIKPLPARVNSISSQYDECKDWWNSVCTVSESGAVGKSISEEYRCWLILSTFSRDILSLVLTFLLLPGERLGKWKCCYGILEAPSRVRLTQASCCDGLHYGVSGPWGSAPTPQPFRSSGKWPSLTVAVGQTPQFQFTPDCLAEISLFPTALRAFSHLMFGVYSQKKIAQKNIFPTADWAPVFWHRMQTSLCVATILFYRWSQFFQTFTRRPHVNSSRWLLRETWAH